MHQYIRISHNTWVIQSAGLPPVPGVHSWRRYQVPEAGRLRSGVRGPGGTVCGLWYPHLRRPRGPHGNWVGLIAVTEQLEAYTIKHCIIHVFLFTVTSHERHGVPNHMQLDSLFNTLFNITTKKTSKLRIARLLSGQWWIPLTKAQPCGKRFQLSQRRILWLSSISFIHYNKGQLLGLLNCQLLPYH